MKRLLLPMFAALVLACAPAGADVIAVYGFGQAGPTQEASADVSAGDVTAGANLSLFTANATDGYPTEPNLHVNPGGATTDVAQAYALGDYFAITITPQTGKVLDYTQLSFKVARGGDATPRNTAIRTDLAGGNNVLDTYAVPTKRATWTDKTVDLTSVAELQNVATARTFYFAVATGNSGRSLEFDDITFEANIVPEPATLALVALGSVALLRRRGH